MNSVAEIAPLGDPGSAAPAAPAATLARRLKEETRHQHQAIEGVVPLLSPDLTLAGYCAHLQALLGFHAPIEEHLAVVLAPNADLFALPQRLRAAALTRDLAVLGAQALPGRCPIPPELGEAAAAVGCLYVLEGSTLGGQGIARHLQRHFGLQADSGAAFLSGHGEQTGPMWRRFQAALARFIAEIPEPAQEAAADAVVRGAQVTFSALHQWLLVAGGSAPEMPSASETQPADR